MAIHQNHQTGNQHLHQGLPGKPQHHPHRPQAPYTPLRPSLDLHRPALKDIIRTTTLRHMGSCRPRLHRRDKRAMETALRHNRGQTLLSNISLFTLVGMRPFHIRRIHLSSIQVLLRNHNSSRLWIRRKRTLRIGKRAKRQRKKRKRRDRVLCLLCLYLCLRLCLQLQRRRRRGVELQKPEPASPRQKR
jgi:hypothetical protein